MLLVTITLVVLVPAAVTADGKHSELVQGTPYGKIHRVHDDGRVPGDNPFVNLAGAYKTTWNYGHRSPQGLEFNHQTQQLWSTEMGPRGDLDIGKADGISKQHDRGEWIYHHRLE